MPLFRCKMSTLTLKGKSQHDSFHVRSIKAADTFAQDKTYLRAKCTDEKMLLVFTIEVHIN